MKTRLADSDPIASALAEMRHLIRAPSRLSVGHWARDSYGLECDVFDYDACAFDLIGAAYFVSGCFNDAGAAELIAAIEDAYGGSLQGITSRLEHGEILALVDRTIEGRGKPIMENDNGKEIYISSSWKNRERVRAIADALRARGLRVYDFTDPACRGTPEIPPEAFPEQFDAERHVYRQYIQSVPNWRAAVEHNRKVLDRCSAVILLLPCGNDGHADWAYAVGKGKPSAVVGAPKSGDRSPTHMWSDALLDSDEEAVEWCVRLHQKQEAA